MTIGGPRVTFLTLEDHQEIQSGLSLNLQVEAADPGRDPGPGDSHRGGIRSPDRSAVQSIRPNLSTVDTSVVIPPGITGEVQVTASARNGLAVTGQDGPVISGDR